MDIDPTIAVPVISQVISFIRERRERGSTEIRLDEIEEKIDELTYGNKELEGRKEELLRETLTRLPRERIEVIVQGSVFIIQNSQECSIKNEGKHDAKSAYFGHGRTRSLHEDSKRELERERLAYPGE